MELVPSRSEVGSLKTEEIAYLGFFYFEWEKDLKI